MGETKNQRGHDGWRVLIEQQQAGQETIVAFCRERGLATQSFHYHKRKMREEAEGGFREVALSGRSAIRLMRGPGGWFVEVERGFDPGCLHAVVRVLG